MTLSIQFGIDDTSDEQPKEEQPEQQHQFAQFHNGAVSVNPATGESTHYTTTTVSAADFAGRHGGGVLATAVWPSDFVIRPVRWPNYGL